MSDQPCKEEDSLRLLTEKEVAEMLRISPGSVRNLRVKGKLPFVQVTSRILFRPESVANYIKVNEFVNVQTGDTTHE